jgi:hypothetical protein
MAFMKCPSLGLKSDVSLRHGGPPPLPPIGPHQGRPPPFIHSSGCDGAGFGSDVGRFTSAARDGVSTTVNVGGGGAAILLIGGNGDAVVTDDGVTSMTFGAVLSMAGAR